MVKKKTTLERILALTGGDFNVPVVLAGQFLGRASQTTRNQISLGTFPLPTFLIGKRRFVQAADLASWFDTQRSKARQSRKSLLQLSKRG